MNKIFRKNKKGDVPVMILVIGIFALCALAILSFYFVKFKALKSFEGYIAVEKVNSLAEEYEFYTNVGLNQENADIATGVQNCDGGRCLIVVRDSGEREIRVVYPLK